MCVHEQKKTEQKQPKNNRRLTAVNEPPSFSRRQIAVTVQPFFSSSSTAVSNI
jgi:hypothetical protein